MKVTFCTFYINQLIKNNQECLLKHYFFSCYLYKHLLLVWYFAHCNYPVLINILKLIENTQLFLKVASAEDDLSVTTSRPKINSISATVSDRERLFNDLFNEYNRKVNPDNCTVKFGVALLNLQVVSDFFFRKTINCSETL